MFQRLKASRLIFGTSSMSGKIQEDSEMGQWVSAQRQAFKYGRLSQERQQKLESIQFVFHTPFNMNTATSTSAIGRNKNSPPATSSLAASELSEDDFRNTPRPIRPNGILPDIGTEKNKKRSWEDNFDALVQYKQVRILKLTGLLNDASSVEKLTQLGRL